MHRKWNKDAIALEILSMYESGENLNYSSVASNNLSLLRAATRYFGTWEDAVKFAGLDYDSIRRYKSWTRERIIERIKELHAQSADLSWRNVCLNIDPQLAAAATKKSHFGSWREALEASGLDYDAIRRYREWDDERILEMVREFPSRRQRAEREEHGDRGHHAHHRRPPPVRLLAQGADRRRPRLHRDCPPRSVQARPRTRPKQAHRRCEVGRLQRRN